MLYISFLCNIFPLGKKIRFGINWRASEARETLFYVNNDYWKYMFLASEQSERDILRCNSIVISLSLFIYMVHRT